MTIVPEGSAGEAQLDEPFDPVLLAVLASRFDAIVSEMTNTLFRTGRSAVLNTAKDFSCSIVTADDDLLASVEGLQVHVFGTGLQTRWMREFHDDMAEGDAYLHNDPYLGNTHTADHTILIPVYIDGEHVLTACAKAHQADCGNSAASTYMPFARDQYEEGGLQFPCVRVQRDYKDVEDVIRMCRRRIRVPEVWFGDYLATLGAARVGERRIKEVVERYGLDVVRRFARAWFDYSERRMTNAVRELPRVTLHGHGRHDPLPGLPDGIPVHVQIDVDPDAGTIAVDLRDNPDCVPAGVNLSEACTLSGVIIGIFNCIDASVPRNAGSFRRLRVQLRENCVVGIPRFPASTSMSTTNMVNRLINAVQAAFTDVGPGWGLAEGGMSMGVGFSVVSGTDPRRDGAPYVNQILIGNNGGPASGQADGWVTYTLPDCACTVYHDSIEIIEGKYPMRVRSQRLLADSGGAGRFRGGPASEVVFGPVSSPLTAYYFCEGHETPPAGVLGGAPGMRASAWKELADGTRIEIDPVGGIELVAGEWVVGIENGGGGYGAPFEREPGHVLEDVREGRVTLGAAATIYGVVLTGASADDSLNIDEHATRARREGATA
jgi:N-methylhydantoinase B